MLDLLMDLWGFLRIRKKFWLLPLFLIMLLMALLSGLSQSAIIAPFIYAIF